jgi:hypothetical protein
MELCFILLPAALKSEHHSFTKKKIRAQNLPILVGQGRGFIF